MAFSFAQARKSRRPEAKETPRMEASESPAVEAQEQAAGTEGTVKPFLKKGKKNRRFRRR
jgi:hypothetical protein